MNQDNDIIKLKPINNTKPITDLDLDDTLDKLEEKEKSLRLSSSLNPKDKELSNKLLDVN